MARDLFNIVELSSANQQQILSFCRENNLSWTQPQIESLAKVRSPFGFALSLEGQWAGLILFQCTYQSQHESEWEILDILVGKAYRRQGLASQLLGLLQEKTEAGVIVLEVRAGNRGAQAFYTELGFRETGIRKGYYPASQAGGIREDAVLMTWKNKGSA